MAAERRCSVAGVLAQRSGTAALAADNMPLPAPAAIGVVLFESRQCAVLKPGSFAIAGPGARRHHRQTPRGGRGSACRSDCAAPAGRSRQRDPAARPADASGARGLAESRNREVVADHQGGRDQGGMSGKGSERSTSGAPDCNRLPGECWILLVAAGSRCDIITILACWKRSSLDQVGRVEAFREPRA